MLFNAELWTGVCRVAGQATDEKATHVRLTLANGNSIDLDLTAIRTSAVVKSAESSAFDTSEQRNELLDELAEDNGQVDFEVNPQIDPELETAKVSC